MNRVWRNRWADLLIGAIIVVLAIALAVANPGRILHDAVAPAVLVALWAVWRWWSQRKSL